MADDKVQIVIEVDSLQAEAALKKFSDTGVNVISTVEKSSNSLGSAFQSVSASVKTLITSFTPLSIIIAVVTTAYEIFTKVMGESAKAAKLNLQINASLAATGEAGYEATSAILAYSNALSAKTGIDDDIINSSFILSKSFGVSTEQAKKLTSAAIDLSAATGQDLEFSTRLLGQTLDGTVGKAGNLGAEFRNLTEDQLKNGAAIDLVSKKYSGAAAEALNTYEGQARRLSNAFDDLFKAIGRVDQAKSSGGIKSFLSGILEGLTGYINKQKDIEETKNALEGIAKLDFQRVGESSKEVSTQFKEIFADSEKASKQITSSLLPAMHTFAESLSVQSPVIKSLELTGKALEEATKKAKALADEGKKFTAGILGSFGDQTATEANKASEAIKSVQDALAKGLFGPKGAAADKQAFDLKILIANDFNAKYLKQIEERNKKEQDEEDKNNKEIVDRRNAAIAIRLEAAKKESDSIGALFSNPFTFKVQVAKGDVVDWTKAGKDFGAAAAGLLLLAGKGKEGAATAISKISGGVGAALLGPEFGPIIEQVVLLLSNGKVVGSLVREFIKALPDILLAIADAVPAVMAAIIETVFSAQFLYKISVAIAKAALSVATLGLLKFIPEWTSKIKFAISQAFNGPIEKIKSIFSGLFDKISGVFQPLIDVFNRLIEPIERLIKAFGGGGGQGAARDFGGKVSSTFKKTFGFSNGGIVPTVYAADGMFVSKGTDTVPAMLTPGELVIPKDRVNAVLNNQAGPSSAQDTALLAAILQVLQMPMTVNTQAVVNQQAFADIILQLSRQNARLSA